MGALLIASFEEKRRLLNQRLSLENELARLVNSIKNGNGGDQKEIEAVATSAQERLKELTTYLDTLLESTYFNEIRADDLTIAQRTFEIPELFELILDHLEIPEILNVQQVSRGLKDAIDGSARIQTRLNLRPASRDTFFKTPFEFYFGYNLGLHCSLEQPKSTPFNEVPLENRTNFTASFDSHSAFPKIGSRCRNMLICQPPIYEMEIHTRCCNGDPLALPFLESDTPKTTSISSPIGITVGDLYDATKKTSKEHKLCPNASCRLLDENGFVRVSVMFKASVELNTNDPILKLYKRRTAEKACEKERRHALKAKQRAYCTAKREGISCTSVAIDDFG